jgi:hypothetical protein
LEYKRLVVTLGAVMSAKYAAPLSASMSEGEVVPIPSAPAKEELAELESRKEPESVPPPRERYEPERSGIALAARPEIVGLVIVTLLSWLMGAAGPRICGLPLPATHCGVAALLAESEGRSDAGLPRIPMSGLMRFESAALN